MASLNKVMLIGNLGKDPEVRVTPGGQPVASFSIATTERWKSKDGKMEEKTEWHNIVLWGRLAELAREYLRKGSPVFIEGRLQTRAWDDRDGKKRYTTEVIGQTMQFLSRGEGKGGERGSSGYSSGGMAEGGESSSQGHDQSPPAFASDDDIPF